MVHPDTATAAGVVHAGGNAGVSAPVEYRRSCLPAEAMGELAL